MVCGKIMEKYGGTKQCKKEETKEEERKRGLKFFNHYTHTLILICAGFTNFSGSNSPKNRRL